MVRRHLLIYIIDMMDKQAINAVLPALKSEFNFSDAQLGAISSVVSVSVGLLCLPVAVIIDRWSRRKIITIMVSLWSLATFSPPGDGFYQPPPLQAERRHR